MFSDFVIYNILDYRILNNWIKIQLVTQASFYDAASSNRVKNFQLGHSTHNNLIIVCRTRGPIKTEPIILIIINANDIPNDTRFVLELIVSILTEQWLFYDEPFPTGFSWSRIDRFDDADYHVGSFFGTRLFEVEQNTGGVNF